MNTRDCCTASASRRPQHLTLIVGALLSVLLGATGGCQGRREPLSQPARILFDSLVAAREAMHDSAGPNPGYERWLCLFTRGSNQLGSEIAQRTSEQASASVDSRHSAEEWQKVNERLLGAHPMPSPESCRITDSLWYARDVSKNRSRP